MREIKFRGKRVDNGEWVYGCFAEFVNYLDGDTKPGIQVTNQVPSGFDRMIPAFETELVEVIPETVGQYTGLKDKNGVEIYEGDILVEKDVYVWEKFTKEDGSEWSRSTGKRKDKKHTVFFDEKTAQFTTEGRWLWSILDKAEVIGNIIDNPELMEEKK